MNSMRTGKVAKSGINQTTARKDKHKKVDTDHASVVLRIRIHDGTIGSDVAGLLPAQSVDDVPFMGEGGLAGLSCGSDDEGK